MRIPAGLVIGLLLATVPALAHDPSAWGGAFRSRDGGATWMPIDAGLFVGGAVALAIDPTNPNHILLATDTRLLRSRNGGRDWSQEPASRFVGPTLAVAFDSSGEVLLAATAAGVFRSDGGAGWNAIDLPSWALPARSIVAGSAAGRFYLNGAHGLFRSADRGQTWTRVAEALPDAPFTAIAVLAQPSETVAAILEGRVLTSANAGTSWQLHSAGLPDGEKLESIVADPSPGRVWAGAMGRLYRSDDTAQTWHSVGEALPQPGTRVRGIAASTDAATIVLTTDRGVYRSADAGKTWTLIEGNLPVHLESGPLVRDRSDLATLYAGFSLTPYDEIWRRAVEGSNLLAQLDPFSLAGGAAFLILLALAAIYSVRRLSRFARRAEATPTRPPAA